jgi:hypothetical protein
MNAIEVLKVAYNNPQLKDYSEESKTIKDALKEALLALEKQKNGLKCIGCGSIPKLKLCCNSCYQRLKLKEKRQVELIEWLEKEIESTGNRLKNAQLNGNSKRQTTSMTRIKALREVLERVGEQK